MESKDTKIEAIHPLSAVQQGALFHHLRQKKDQGLLHVECNLAGALNENALKEAWQKVCLRHPILRTSVHWKEIKTPVQVVRPHLEPEWQVHDFSVFDKDTQPEKLAKFKREDKEIGVDLSKNPSSNISLIKLDQTRHLFLWKCHHLLLDGWSAALILKDTFSFYEAICTNTTLKLDDVPSYKSYLEWSTKRNSDQASAYWRKTFSGFVEPKLFTVTGRQSDALDQIKHLFDKEDTVALKQLAQSQKITLNTLFQGMYSLLLSKYFSTSDLCFGATVSGRSSEFPNIELMAGMFSNMLPVRAVFDTKQTVQKWLQEFQLNQHKARNYEASTTEEIRAWTDNRYSGPLFDTLFIFENFPWKPIKSGALSVLDFKSGITTTYPLNFMVNVQQEIEVSLLYDRLALGPDTATWFLENMKTLVKAMNTKGEVVIEWLLDTLKEPGQQQKNVLKKSEQTYVAPKNNTELELVKIWQDIFPSKTIGVKDDFFDLGGKSLMAVRMVSRIKTNFGTSLPAIALLENPTIQQLSAVINGDTKLPQWDFLVPVKSKGERQPLFCVHGGGGHVFFFNPLANGFKEDTPVYALQPAGIGDGQNMHKTIVQMAKDYCKEIRQVCSHGPYQILVYCFSTAVGIEMANYFEELGEDSHLIIVDSLPEQENFEDKSRIKLRIEAFISRFAKNPFSSIALMIGNHANKRLKPLWTKTFGSKEEKQLEHVQANLRKIYEDYPWAGKHNAKVSLLLTDKHPMLNEQYRKSWTNLSKKEVSTYNVSGIHHQLFKGVYAEQLAKVIEPLLHERTSN